MSRAGMIEQDLGASLETSDLQLGDADAWTGRLMGNAGDFIGSEGIKVDALISKGGENVGEWLASRNAEAKQGWGALRAAQRAGAYTPNVAERVRLAQDEQMAFDPGVGGWKTTSPPKPEAAGNLNVKKQGGSSSASNPFESRLFKGASHYAVADRSDETYAYSGARGIFAGGGVQPYVPEHYRRAQAQRAVPTAAATKAANTDVSLKGGWPVDYTYGARADDPCHVAGWSIEKTSVYRGQHALHTHLTASM